MRFLLFHLLEYIFTECCRRSLQPYLCLKFLIFKLDLAVQILDLQVFLVEVVFQFADVELLELVAEVFDFF